MSANGLRKSLMIRFDINSINQSIEENFDVIRKTESEPKWKNGELDSQYQCPSCNGYLRFPIQFEDCGHHICSSCLPDIMRYEPDVFLQ
jgi:hypothetical protein